MNSERQREQLLISYRHKSGVNIRGLDVDPISNWTFRILTYFLMRVLQAIRTENRTANRTGVDAYAVRFAVRKTRSGKPGWGIRDFHLLYEETNLLFSYL